MRREKKKEETFLYGTVILHGISRDGIIKHLNIEQRDADIERFKGHTLRSAEHRSKAELWLKIACLADIRLKKQSVYIRTNEGTYLVDRWSWQREAEA